MLLIQSHCSNPACRKAVQVDGSSPEEILEKIDVDYCRAVAERLMGLKPPKASAECPPYEQYEPTLRVL